MELNDIGLKDLGAVKKNCLYINDNKAVTRQKELYKVNDVLGAEVSQKLYFETKEDMNGIYYNVYCDYGFICYALNMSFSKWATIDEAIKRLSIPENQLEYEFMKNIILNNAKNGNFVNVAEIRLLSLDGEHEDVIQTLVNCRHEYLENRRKKDEEERQQKLIKATEKYNTMLADFNNTLAEAEKMILDKKQVINKEIELPTLDEHYVYTEEKSLILELFKKHSIKIPLKTQGWINKALYSIKWMDAINNYSYDYYTSSKNSTVFSEYLEKLINSIKKQNGFIVYEKEPIQFDFTGFTGAV